MSHAEAPHEAAPASSTGGGSGRKLEMWKAMKDSYKEGRNGEGHLTSGFRSLFSGEYVKSIGEAMRTGLADIPIAGVNTLVKPITMDLSKLPSKLFESANGMKLEIGKDIAKPIAATIGHIRDKIIGNIDIFHPFSSIAKMSWGALKTPFIFASKSIEAIVHLPGDFASFIPSVLGAVTTGFSAVTEQVSASIHRFGEGLLVLSDLVEKTCNNFFVPPAWRENRNTEYDNITAYGETFGIKH